MSNLIVLNGATAVVAQSAAELKENALAAGALIARVNSPEEQAEAVEAQRAIKALIKQVEDSRVAIKAPVLELGKKIDATAKAYVEDLAKEDQRLSALCGDYQMLLLKKQRAEEKARNAELLEIERKKQEEIAKARNHEHLEAIEEKFHHQVAAVNPPLVVVSKAEGQVVKEEWEVEVVHDPYLLMRNFPNCIKPVPILTEIKRLLDQGVKIPGVTAKKVVKSSVRLSPQPKLIEVGN